MTTDTERTAVIFRVFHAGDLIALFPEVPHAPGLCSSYQHVGQHGGADYAGCVAVSRPATPAEYAPLAAELRGLGYNLEILQRRRPVHEVNARADAETACNLAAELKRRQEDAQP